MECLFQKKIVLKSSKILNSNGDYEEVKIVEKVKLIDFSYNNYSSFNYSNIDENKKIVFNYEYLHKKISYNQCCLNEIKSFQEIYIKNNKADIIKYSQFLIKLINLFKINQELQKELETDIEKVNTCINCQIFVSESEHLSLEEIILFLKNIFLISLYFNNFPYIYKELTYKKTKDLFQENFDTNTFREARDKTLKKASTLSELIRGGMNILGGNGNLQNVQIFFVYVFGYCFFL